MGASVSGRNPPTGQLRYSPQQGQQQQLGLATPGFILTDVKQPAAPRLESLNQRGRPNFIEQHLLVGSGINPVLGLLSTEIIGHGGHRETARSQLSHHQISNLNHFGRASVVFGRATKKPLDYSAFKTPSWAAEINTCAMLSKHWSDSLWPASYPRNFEMKPFNGNLLWLERYSNGPSLPADPPLEPPFIALTRPRAYADKNSMAGAISSPSSVPFKPATGPATRAKVNRNNSFTAQRHVT